MKAKLLSAHGFQGNAMDLPVADADAATAFYVEQLGFEIGERTAESHKKVVLNRDGIEMALVENGGDPEQDGCAFHTNDIDGLRSEFIANGLDNIGSIDEEKRDGATFRVFFVVAPDGLCFWFGQKQ